VTIPRLGLVHEAEVHDIDPDLGINHAAKGGEDVVPTGACHA